MAIKSLDDLFVHFLRDMYYAEKQILKALPKMARKADSASSARPRAAPPAKPRTTSRPSSRCSSCSICRPAASPARRSTASSREAKEIMSETEDADARDAGMIAAAQAVEHYEITRYGTMIAWASSSARPRP